MYSDSSSEDELEEMLMQLIILRKRRVRKRSLPKRTRKAPRFWVQNIFQQREDLSDFVIILFSSLLCFTLHTQTQHAAASRKTFFEICFKLSVFFDVFLNHELT